MIIKQAEDRNRDVEALNLLLAMPNIGADTKNKITQEIKKIQSGKKGEDEAAYNINFHWGDSKNWMIIHDLRLEYGGHVAQIDHLLLNRFLDIYVLESKRFGEGISINEHGEFSAFYQSKPYGISSPIEQNDRHIHLLKKMIDKGCIELPVRLGFRLKPKLLSLILIANSARISRPQNANKIQGLDRIIKNEQIKKKVHRDIDTENPLSAVASASKIISSETLQTFAQSLAALHQPLSIDWKARFGVKDLPEPPAAIPELPVSAAEAVIETTVEPAAEIPAQQDADAHSDASTRLFCAACKKSVSEKVADFCWSNKKCFQGRVYCYTCQRTLKRNSPEQK